MTDQWVVNSSPETTPMTFDFEQILTSAQLNAELRDRLQWLFERNFHYPGVDGLTANSVRVIDNTVLPADFMTHATGWNSTTPDQTFLCAVHDDLNRMWFSPNKGVDWFELVSGGGIIQPIYKSEYAVHNTTLTPSGSSIWVEYTAARVSVPAQSAGKKLLVRWDLEMHAPTDASGFLGWWLICRHLTSNNEYLIDSGGEDNNGSLSPISGHKFGVIASPLGAGGSVINPDWTKATGNAHKVTTPSARDYRLPEAGGVAVTSRWTSTAPTSHGWITNTQLLTGNIVAVTEDMQFELWVWNSQTSNYMRANVYVFPIY